jgi:hypothetical protein
MRFTPVLVATALCATLPACGAAPDGSSEPTEATNSAYTLSPRPPPLPPAWDLYPSGVVYHWVNGAGATTNDVTITYRSSTQLVQHDGSLSYVIWDNLASQGYADGCHFRFATQATDAYLMPAATDQVGPLLCSGAPYFGDILPSYPSAVPGDVLSAAFSRAAGDTVPNVCRATNGHGLTVSTYVQIYATAAAGNDAPSYLAYDDMIPLTVTLACQ